ncbi:MAG: hypothetical protein GX219_10350 [Tissierellia bacterium]|nr:hypothetical protein [Tissierellia bacterium]
MINEQETIFKGFIDHDMQKILKNKINNKLDVIKLILYTTRYILIGHADKDYGHGSFEISSPKKNRRRIYFYQQSKESTITYPYIVKPISLHEWTVSDSFARVLLDSKTISILLSIFNELSNNITFDLEDLNFKISESLRNFDSLESKQDISIILYHLLARDYGYIRHDYCDSQGYLEEKPHVHPRKHLDFNYNELATFKIGLRENKDMVLKELIDPNADCLYLGSFEDFK